jgi:pyruvate formate lyase activating enzyme
MKSRLFEHTVSAEAPLVIPVPDRKDWVQCLACGHRCRIPPEHSGICKVRSNREGTLRIPHGYVGSLAVDPVEKKPFFHVLPGSNALSFGMLGCDLHCGYCQNWLTSQTLRDPEAVAPLQEITAAELVADAVQSESRVVVSTYNEPLITSEWARAVFEEAKRADLLTGYVSNGNGPPEVREYRRPGTDLYKVDLKGFRERSYRSLGGVLARVLDTLADLKERGFWVEVVTLLVPGFNDSDEELRDLTRFLADLDPLMPWHVTAFHTDYKMAETPNTQSASLLHAAEIAVESGLKFVYCGNRTGDVNEWEDTRCHGCDATLIRRLGFHILENRLLPGGVCPDCSTRIPGVWD